MNQRQRFALEHQIADAPIDDMNRFTCVNLPWTEILTAETAPTGALWHASVAFHGPEGGVRPLPPTLRVAAIKRLLLLLRGVGNPDGDEITQSEMSLHLWRPLTAVEVEILRRFEN